MVSSVVGLFTTARYLCGRFAVLAAVGVVAAIVAPTAAAATPAAAAPAVIATIPLGTVPLGTATDPVTNTVYVTNVVANTVSVISGRTDTGTATIPVGANPHGVATHPR